MKTKNLALNNSISKNLLNQKFNLKFKKSYLKNLQHIRENVENPNNFFNIFSENYDFNFKMNDLKKFKFYKNVAIIGMGGSILGAQAIFQFYEDKIKKNFFFFNNIDYNKISNFKKKYNLNKVLFIVISKSGNTIETLSNLISLKILKKNAKNIIVISEKNSNSLYSISKKFNLFFIEHNKYFGGRYSVLSEVGIIPIYFMDLNIKKFRKNIKKVLEKKNSFFLKESSMMLSNFLKKNKYRNIILLNYSPKLEQFLLWCQQLLAESLGKKGKGFLPVISNAPKDHHSLLQLYLSGPKDKIFYIFSLDEKSGEKIKTKKISKKIEYLNNKSLNHIKSTQRKALIKTFKTQDIPFREFIIKNNDQETIGELFAYFMFETIIIGNLTGINPFGQPAVENVKSITKKMLI